MRWAHVIDDVVVNVIIWDGEAPYSVPVGDLVHIEHDSRVGVGWTRDGVQWAAPPPEEP